MTSTLFGRSMDVVSGGVEGLSAAAAVFIAIEEPGRLLESVASAVMLLLLA